MQRKRDKTHTKAKKTKKNTHWEHFKNLRKEVLNRFWSFFKQTKTKNLGIATLRSNNKMQTTDHA